MNSLMEDLLQKLNINELYQLTIILKIDCNGSRKDIHQRIFSNYDFDYIYKTLMNLAKYKYFVICDNNNSSYYVDEGTDQFNHSIKNMHFDVIKECNSCKKIHNLHQYESIFYIEMEDNKIELLELNKYGYQSINDSDNIYQEIGDYYKNNNNKFKCGDICILL